MSAHCSDNPQIRVVAELVELGEIPPPLAGGSAFFLLGRELCQDPFRGFPDFFLFCSLLVLRPTENVKDLINEKRCRDRFQCCGELPSGRMFSFSFYDIGAIKAPLRVAEVLYLCEIEQQGVRRKLLMTPFKN